MLSVVVPVHNVARWLDVCLESLAAQTHRDLEVVLVDDGSTDGSGEIAAGWPARDPRFRVVHQANAGLGAARNAGAALATGTYLAFVDADDVLPPYAFEVLVNALERTGSDFASGNVALLTDGELTPSPLHRGTHRQTRLAVDPREHRYLVYDRLACNKVWRRSFWGETRFPEGVHYEDIPVTVPLYGRARQVDVIDLPVYYWRQRPAGDPSISQRLAEQRNLDDRFAAVTFARRELSALDGPFATWYAETALQSDLRLVLEVLPDVDDAYRARFVKLATAFLADVEPAVLTRLPGRLASAWQLTRDGDVDGLVRLVSSVRAASAPGAGMAAWRAPAAQAVRATAADWADGRLRIELADERVPAGVALAPRGRAGQPGGGAAGRRRVRHAAPVPAARPAGLAAGGVDGQRRARAATPRGHTCGSPGRLLSRPAGWTRRRWWHRWSGAVCCGSWSSGPRWSRPRLTRTTACSASTATVRWHRGRCCTSNGRRGCRRWPSRRWSTARRGRRGCRWPTWPSAIGTPAVPDEPPAVWLAALGEPGGPTVPLVGRPPPDAGHGRSGQDRRRSARRTAGDRGPGRRPR